MSKARVVVDFAYKGPRRKGRGTGYKGLKNTLKYFQYRDTRHTHLQQNAQHEHWHDFGMGIHYREILQQCDQHKSPHVLAWTWVVSPAPDLMALVPEQKRPQLICDLTEQLVEDYYLARGFDIPEYSYVLHDRLTDAEDGKVPMQQLHTHVVLPGTAPSLTERQPVYNNTERGHDHLFREIATQHFEAMLDDIVGHDWRRLRDDPGQVPDDRNDFDT